MDKSGRGNFTPRAFAYKGVDGKEYTWAGRGRWPKELAAVIESESASGSTVTKDALAAHKKNKPTGNPVGRPKGSKTATEIKAVADAIVAQAPEV
jgi:hypothetical protein